MIAEILIIVALLAAIVVLAVYLAKCRNKDDSTSQQMATRPKPQHPAIAAYQDYVKNVTLPPYEYKMYELFTVDKSVKKYQSPSLEAYTLADYDKVPNCSCKNMTACTYGRKSRGWTPSSDTI